MAAKKKRGKKRVKKSSSAKKRTTTRKKKRTAKGHIPLRVLKKRYGKLGHLIMKREKSEG